MLINVFAVFIFISSVFQMMYLLKLGEDGFSGYKLYMNAWPEQLLIARYAFSHFQRIVGITTAVGLVYRKELFRKIIIILGCFTLCVLYWKHPYYVFENEAKLAFSEYPALKSSGLNPSTIARFGLITLNVCEVLFWGATIFYFTRQRIKDQFKPFKGNSF